MTEPRCYRLITAKIHDRKAFLTGYAQATATLVEQFGGRYILRVPGAKVIEGRLAKGHRLLFPSGPTVKRH